MLRKREELLLAMKKWRENTIVIYGPPGTGKTYMIREVCRELSLRLEEIDSINEYTNRRLGKNIVYYLDTDSVERGGTEQFRGLIVETREKYLHKGFGSAVLVSLNRVTQRDMKKIVGKEVEIKKFEGNLHRAKALSSFPREMVETLTGNHLQPDSIFHYLGKLFYSKDIYECTENLGLYGTERMAMYIHENYPAFFDVKGALSIAERLSASATQHFSCDSVLSLVVAVAKEEKKGPRSFYSFRSPHRVAPQKDGVGV
jgi:ATPase family associated with various cellular activities (AAA)